MTEEPNNNQNDQLNEPHKKGLESDGKEGKKTGSIGKGVGSSNTKDDKNHIVNFFSKYNKVITGIAAIFGLIGIFFTVYQIRETKIQIRANTSYQIHKDGREIIKTVSPEIFDIITEKYPQKQYDEHMLRDAESKINEILMYYAALYKQFEYGNIDKKSWSDLSKEMCNFLHFKRVQNFWKNRVVNSKMWNPNFIQFGNSCILTKGE